MTDLKKLCPIRRCKYRFGVYSRTKRDLHVFSTVTLFIIIIIPIILMLLRAEQRLGIVALRLAEAQLDNAINTYCSRSTSQLLDKYKIDSGAIISASSSENGKTNAISADFSKLNLLKSELSADISEYLNNISPLECSVPLGALISDSLFAAWGAKLPTRTIVSGSVKVDLFDEFDSAGINQTRYRLMLRVTVTAQLHTIYEYTERDIVTDIPLAESITVGEVPQITVGNDNSGAQ